MALLIAGLVILPIVMGIGGGLYFKSLFRRDLAEHAVRLAELARQMEENAAVEASIKKHVRLLDDAIVRYTLTQIFRLGEEAEERRSTFRVLDGGSSR